jgi:hypothetical protein
MHQRRVRRNVIVAAVGPSVVASAAPDADATSAAAGQRYPGLRADGAAWVADVPASWNGTIILYSYGFGPLTAQEQQQADELSNYVLPFERPRWSMHG